MNVRPWAVGMAVALGMTIAVLPAEARLTRSVSIDRDISTADVAMIGTVVGTRVATKRAPGPFQSTVDVVEHSVRVEVAYGGSSRGQLVRVFHPRVLPSSKMVINGFGPVQIQRGKAYLFFLDTRKAGGHALVAAEDQLVQIPRWSLATLRRFRAGSPIHRLIRALEYVVQRCPAKCSATIWKLQSSAVRKKLYAGQPRRRAAYVKSLIRVTRVSKDGNTLNSAYTSLGYLKVMSVIPRIIKELTARPRRGSKRILSNSISWLQGFPNPVQIKALATIVAKAKDPGVVTTAKRRLAWMRRQP